MITKNLFEKVLIEPIAEGADKLLIVSGFATAAMAYHHLSQLKSAKRSVNVELIVGMSKQVGLPLSNHKGFQKLVQLDFSDSFRCSYVHTNPSVHSKLYVWLKNGKPFKAFTGSANYTQFAFTIQREILDSTNAEKGFEYFNLISDDTIYCDHVEVEDYITIYSDKQYYRRFFEASDIVEKDFTNPNRVTDPRPSARISLLMKNGEVHNTAGLNWAFRPEGKAQRGNLNEAYISLPPDVYQGDFFPPRSVEFSVLTDDGISLICSRGQKKDASGISTPQGNALLGEYFRNRLGLAYGTKVTRKHLDLYGRTDVEFFKNDDETYEMDFSV